MLRRAGVRWRLIYLAPVGAGMRSNVSSSAGRLTLAGRTRPLDDLTYQLLCDWLEHRRARWPGTVNHHVILNRQTAVESGPVSRVWLTTAFRGQTATLERLRVQRQLDEALTQGPDPLHLAAVFGLDPKTASATPRTPGSSSSPRPRNKDPS